MGLRSHLPPTPPTPFPWLRQPWLCPSKQKATMGRKQLKVHRIHPSRGGTDPAGTLLACGDNNNLIWKPEDVPIPNPAAGSPLAAFSPARADAGATHHTDGTATEHGRRSSTPLALHLPPRSACSPTPLGAPPELNFIINLSASVHRAAHLGPRAEILHHRERDERGWETMGLGFLTAHNWFGVAPIPRKAAGDPSTHVPRQRETQPGLGGTWEPPKSRAGVSFNGRLGALTKRGTYITSKAFN